MVRCEQKSKYCPASLLRPMPQILMICRGLLIAVGLAIAHWEQTPAVRPFLNYDASISYVNDHGDTVWINPQTVWKNCTGNKTVL